MPASTLEQPLKTGKPVVVKRLPKTKKVVTKTATVKKKRKRSEYSEAKKQLVRDHYQHCITRDEKIELARRIGIEEPEKNLHKLYNLASREKATRNHADYEEEYGATGADQKRPN